MKFSVNINMVRLADTVLHVLYILVDFVCTLYQLIRSVEIPNYNCGLVYYSFQFSRFLLHIFYSSVIM